MAQFPFKSYSWSVGTTSFRTIDFNARIELQLSLLDSFWALKDNKNKTWREMQVKYYNYLKDKKFVKGDAPNPAKDAREKTSGLSDIGLIDNERKLTPVGKVLLDISKRNDFKSDNLLQIPSDCFLYLKQLLKTSNDVDGKVVRPFIVTVYMILQLEYLTEDEFTYLLPLCTTMDNTETIIKAIKDIRNGVGSINDVIVSRLMSMDNYREALEYFLFEDLTENVITVVGMNRKSGENGKKAYDKPYYHFFELLYSIAKDRNKENVLPLFQQSEKLIGKPAAIWRKYLFNTAKKRKLEQNGLAALNDVPIFHASMEYDFKRLFFEQMHLFKAKANLSDYADLNRRYFKLSNILLFYDGKVELDVLPCCWLHSIMNNFKDIAFCAACNLTENVELKDIAPFLTIDEQVIYKNFNMLYKKSAITLIDINRIINEERYKRFNSLIDERFNYNKLIELLDKFEKRDDDAIRKAVTNNADIPTIFEYVIGIAWYLISDRCGDILNYMNLSLEADLLPRTHAGGGVADIEYKYEKTDMYPEHTLLIEATLTDKTNQRRSEMEPVSRHLGEYILKTKDKNAYCLFVPTHLNKNVTSDFRNRKTYIYYSEKSQKNVEGLKIIPLATEELKTILRNYIKYDKLFILFESAYHSNTPVVTWYEEEINNIINTM